MGMAAILVKWPGSFEQAFTPPFQGDCTWNLASISLVVIEEKNFKNIESERFAINIWAKVNEWPWPLVLLKLHVLIQLTASTNFYITDYNSFWISIIIPPTNYVCGGVYCFHIVRPSIRLSVRPSVTFWFFFNILKRQWWKFIKFCRHIDIDKMYVYNRKLRARGQFYWSYCPL